MILASSASESVRNCAFVSKTIVLIAAFPACAGTFFIITGAYAVIFGISAIAVLPSMSYFVSQEYSDGQDGIWIYLRGSAVCTRKQTVMAWDPTLLVHVMATRNLCELTRTQGILTLCAVLACALLMVLFWVWMGGKVERMDNGMQSAQDYSVVVHDPDLDAKDPDEWYKYFSQFGMVASITIALDNGKFLDALVNRRLYRMAHKVANQNHEDYARHHPDHPEHHFLTDAEKKMNMWVKQEIAKTTKNVHGVVAALTHGAVEDNETYLSHAMDSNFNVARVFCIFEHESAQRNCLGKLSNGLLNAWFDLGGLRTEFKFREKNVLNISESPEPPEVIYERLCNDTMLKIFGRYCMVWAIVGLGVAASLQLVGWISGQYGIYTVAAIISLIQELLTEFVWRTAELERHEYRSQLSLSLMHKTFLFDILTGACAIYWYTDWSRTLDEIYLDQVQQVLLFDSFATPVFAFLQPIVFFQRNVIAPRIESGPLRENYFRGSLVSLGQEFGHISASIFLGMFYVALLPAGVVMTVVAMVVNYWTSKHGLFRRWLRIPVFGTALLPTMCGFTGMSIVLSMRMSTQFYAGWPFDTVCPYDTDGVGVDARRDVSVTNASYYICDKVPKDIVLMTTHDWMSVDQVFLVNLFKYISVWMAVVLVFWWFTMASLYSVRALFHGYPESPGEDQGRPYTTVDEVQGFIPFVMHELLETPLLACDRSEFNDEYIHFQAEYELYDLYLEVKLELEKAGTPEKLAGLFSECRYFPTTENPDPLEKDDAGDDGFGVFYVHIEEGRGVSLKDNGKPRGMCVVVTYEENKWTTKTCTKTAIPIFQDEFMVQITDLEQHVHITLYEVELRVQTTILGTYKVDPMDLVKRKPPQGNVWEEEIALRPENAGTSKNYLAGGTEKNKGGVLDVKFEWIPNEANVEHFFNTDTKVIKTAVRRVIVDVVEPDAPMVAPSKTVTKTKQAVEQKFAIDGSLRTGKYRGKLGSVVGFMLKPPGDLSVTIGESGIQVRDALTQGLVCGWKWGDVENVKMGVCVKGESMDTVTFFTSKQAISIEFENSTPIMQDVREHRMNHPEFCHEGEFKPPRWATDSNKLALLPGADTQAPAVMSQFFQPAETNKHHVSGSKIMI